MHPGLLLYDWIVYYLQISNREIEQIIYIEPAKEKTFV